MHLMRLVSCALLANRVEERFLKPGEELGNCGAQDTDSESIIPDDLPSSNHSLVEKVVAETGEPEGSERKILEKKQQGKMRGESLVCFTLSSYADPTPKSDEEEVCAFPSLLISRQSLLPSRRAGISMVDSVLRGHITALLTALNSTTIERPLKPETKGTTPPNFNSSSLILVDSFQLLKKKDY